LIRRTVAEQVRELVARERSTSAPTGEIAERVRRILDRQYLTGEELREIAGSGVVKMPKESPPREGKASLLEPEAEARRALRAFEEGAYFVIVDGRQAESLDEELRFAPGTKVTFLRVMPLAGG
jgi:hypothetical protein